MTSLSRRAGELPLYAQLADLLAQRISSGELSVGDRLPTEHTLAQEHGLSRATVIKALGTLESRGVVIKRQGKGTFVTAPPMDRPLQGLGGFSQHVQSLGLIPTHELVGRFRTPRTDDPLHALFEGEDELLELHRKRFVTGALVGLQRSILPLHVALEIGLEDPHVQDEDFSLYERLGASSFRLHRASESLRAINCSPDDGHSLAVEPGTALIEAVRQSRDAEGTLIEVAQARYLGSWYVYRIELTPPTRA